jgi:chromosome segregation ATPase
VIYLVFKMFIYLLVSTGAGFAAGWLLNQLRADKMVHSAQEASNNSKTMIPQLESSIRTREQAIERLKSKLAKVTQTLNQTESEFKEAKRAVRNQAQAIETLKAQVVHLEDLAHRDERFDTPALPSQSEAPHALSQVNSILEQDLADALSRIAELEKERDLQHNSLKVLHSQLELRRGEAAAG